jgi:putative glutamine amidotransferase
VHRNWEIYDQHAHEIEVAPNSCLSRWYAGQLLRGPVRVNSVHHQGLKTLGRGLVVEATSIPDGVIEAVRYDPRVARSWAPPGEAHRGRVWEPFEGSQDNGGPFAYGVQWHPEFTPLDAANLLDPQVLLGGFLEEVAARGAARDGKPPRKIEVVP